MCTICLKRVLTPKPNESLIVLSDVHLGSDIQETLPSGTSGGSGPRRTAAVDRDLARLFAYYRDRPPPSARWRMVIAGDFIDFIGMTVAAPLSSRLDTELTPEEESHGVGSAMDHARLKLSRVVARHTDVFEQLGAFVAAGHALSVIHGNHDIEFYWAEVRADFQRALFASAQRIMTPSQSCTFEEFSARIQFHPWFFYSDGVAYIEHGHQYDAYCSTEHIMAPISPIDTRRVARGFSDILIRYVVRPTRGMTEHGHDKAGLFDYLGFAFRLGATGMARLGLNFVRAVVEMFRERRAYLSQSAKRLRAEHEACVAAFARNARLSVERVRSLLALHARPVTQSVLGIMRGVLLDRAAVALASAVMVLTVGVFGKHVMHPGACWALGVGIVVGWLVANSYLQNQRMIDPSHLLADRAAHVAKLFPAAFVVMGHTHVPTSAPAGNARYINVGSWSEEVAETHDPDAQPLVRAARTHLVIHIGQDAPEATLLTWGEEGPQQFESWEG